MARTNRSSRRSFAKALPNVISGARIVLALALLLVEPLSGAFFVLYIAGGLSDMMDGFLARRWGAVSRAGAVLDSVGDVVLVLVLLVVLLPILHVPGWVWWWIGGIVVVRFASMGVGFARFHAWATLHTWANKATGLALFCFPVLFALFGSVPSAIALCIIASASAVEELVLNATTRELDRDIRGLW